MRPHIVALYNVNRLSQEATLLNNVKLKGEKTASIPVVLGGIKREEKDKIAVQSDCWKKMQFFKALGVIGRGGNMQIRCGTVSLLFIEGLPDERRRSVKLENKLRVKGYLCSG